MRDETREGLYGLGASLLSVVPFPDFLGLIRSVRDGPFKLILVAKLKQIRHTMRSRYRVSSSRCETKVIAKLGTKVSDKIFYPM